MSNHLKNKHQNKWNELQKIEKDEKKLGKANLSSAMALKKRVQENTSAMKQVTLEQKITKLH